MLLAALSQPVILSANDDPQYSLLAASFTYHIYPPGQHTQYFDNELIALTRTVNQIEQIDRIVVGTLKNSSDNRCLMLGVGQDWQQINSKTKLVGLYAYVGEFFWHNFEECDDDGIYADLDNLLGLGFAPYIYHGIKYNFTPQSTINGGLILPGVLSFALEYSF